MKRLLLWNLLLAISLTAGIYELRRQWLETRAQEESVLLRKPAAPKGDATPPAVKPGPFQATNYTDVAQKLVFAKDRNPNVEIVAPPPPPPPPPMPALPHLYGVLSLPSGFVALMTERSGTPQVKVRPGDKVGEFKLEKLNAERIVLTWNDKTVDKSVDEMLDRTPAPAPAGEPARAAAAAAPPAEPPPPAGPPEMGIEIGPPGHSVRACLDKSKENSPAGTVIGNYKKSIENTPFGPACRWLSTN